MNAASHHTVTSLFETRSTASDAERQSLEDEIIRRHLRLARRLARRYRGRGADADDLAQVANLALVRAMHGFDPAKGSFAPFATATILGELKRYFRDHCWSVRPPRRLQDLQADIARATTAFWHEHAVTPTSAQLASLLEVSADQIREAQAASGCFHAASLDVSTRTGTQTVGDLIVDGGPDAYARIDDAATVTRAMQDLDDDQRELISLRFYDRLTQQQIADRTGVSQMQVSRRLAQLLDQLRMSIGAIAA